MQEISHAVRSRKRVQQVALEGGELPSRTEANVLLWCFNALEYLRSTNALYRVTEGSGLRRDAPEPLLAACAPLQLPPSVANLVDLVQVLPNCVRQVRAFDLPKGAIERSIDAVASRCAMTPAERRLLLFGITLHESELLEHFLDRCFGRVNSGALFKVLAHLLEVPLADVQSALRSDGFLNRAGLLRLDPRPLIGIDNCIDIGMGVAETFEVADGDWDTIVCRTCVPAKASSLTRADFAHMADEWDLVLGYLQGCSTSRRVGANVLLYGASGCGKTEFARAVLAASGRPGYELNARKLDGSAMCTQRRRSAYLQACQYLQSEQPGVIIVDEMDGMLETETSTLPGFMGEDRMSKAAANAQLESNPVPTIWIVNDPAELDAALMRRFDLLLAFRRPSTRKLHQLLATRLAGRGLSEEWLGAVAASSKITPGLVGTLSQVATSVEAMASEPQQMQRLLDTALRQRGIRIARPRGDAYRAEYCNPSVPLQALLATLERKADARCLLHGATGTGKTAFARHMAEVLDLEPRLVRPSDVLDPYVGGTERNIARLFGSAVPEETLLVLDEFESFAADRKGARHNWQVSQVNELLTQLEGHEGRVIACTNIVDYLDPAIRRRFQLKVELRPLTQEQRCKLFTEFCRKLGLAKRRRIDAEHWVGGMADLAYGHLANAAEIAVNRPELTLADFADLLCQELEATNGKVARPIGFAH